MPLVAEEVDAIVGGDTHRDTHALEMTASTGATISTLEINNDEAGSADALAWLVEHAPGAVRRTEARRLAIAIRESGHELKDNEKQLAALADKVAPRLQQGGGPISASQAIVSWSHAGRCRSDAAFAALAGASGIPANSSRVVLHRYNRGGDRSLNRALHDVSLTLWRLCPRTHAYIAKRQAEGKGGNEIRRGIKRYVACDLYHSLEASSTA